MTTIAGIVKDGTVAMAADGASQWNGSIVSRSAKKIITWPNGVAIGVSGEWRTVRVISLIEDMPEVIEEIWQRIKKAMGVDGYLFAGGGGSAHGSTNCGNSFLVIDADGDLWSMTGDGGYSASEDSNPCTVGSGSNEAIGALDVMVRYRHPLQMTAGDIVRVAIEVSSVRDSGTGGIIQVVTRKRAAFDGWDQTTWP